MHNRGVEEFNLHNIFQLNALAHILPSDLTYLFATFGTSSPKNLLRVLQMLHSHYL
jgi:hypothetical protein